MKDIISINKNIAIYVDYENIFNKLKSYGIQPFKDLDFFRVIGELFKGLGSNVLKYIAYANFNDTDFNNMDQIQIQEHGLSEIHNYNNSTTTANSLLTMDVLSDLFMQDNITKFIIISSEKNLINLVKAIKCENKSVCCILTKNEINYVVREYIGDIKYIEDIFGFNSKCT